jgi:hypothetical protein
MIFTVLIVAVAAVGGLAVYASTTPDTMIVQRSTAVNAPPARIFPLIDDFREWSKWSPWEKLDPALQRTYSGAASGPGAVYDWSGNRQAGQGRMEIMDTTPPVNVSIKLDFIKPFEGHNVVAIAIEPSGGATTVTWRMTGPREFLLKVMGVFMNLDKLIGKDFERGLANLKKIAEQ